MAEIDATEDIRISETNCTSEVVIGGAGGAAAPPIIETVRVLKGCQPPQKIARQRARKFSAPPIFRP